MMPDREYSRRTEKVATNSYLPAIFDTIELLRKQLVNDRQLKQAACSLY
jgi:hypothetical protein